MRVCVDQNAATASTGREKKTSVASTCPLFARRVSINANDCRRQQKAATSGGRPIGDRDEQKSESARAERKQTRANWQRRRSVCGAGGHEPANNRHEYLNRRRIDDQRSAAQTTAAHKRCGKFCALHRARSARRSAAIHAARARVKLRASARTPRRATSMMPPPREVAFADVRQKPADSLVGA